MKARVLEKSYAVSFLLESSFVVTSRAVFDVITRWVASSRDIATYSLLIVGETFFVESCVVEGICDGKRAAEAIDEFPNRGAVGLCD